VFNHKPGNRAAALPSARPGADYAHSLHLLKEFKARFPQVPTKSGLMVGLGRTMREVLQVMRELAAHTDANMLTHVGQYLQPSDGTCRCCATLRRKPLRCSNEPQKEMGFSHAACGPMVRSSYLQTSRRIGQEYSSGGSRQGEPPGE